jgi:hypothetical protein
VAAVLISPALLLSKSPKHFVTVGYTDNEGRQQALLFRVSKGDIRTVLASLEARPGRVSNTRMTMPEKMASNARHTPRVGQSSWPVMAFSRCLCAALCTPAAFGQEPPSPGSIEEAGLRQLRMLRRVYVDRLTGGETAAQMRDILVTRVDGVKLFILTENCGPR